MITVIKKWFWFTLFLLIGLLFLLIGIEGLYIGIFASPEELSNYPFGTELGWSYLNKHNYMVSGVIKSIIAWLPMVIYSIVKRNYNQEKPL